MYKNRKTCQKVVFGDNSGNSDNSDNSGNSDNYPQFPVRICCSYSP